MNQKTLIMVLFITLFLTVLMALISYIILLKSNKKKDLRVNLKYKKDFLYSSYGIAIKFSPLKKYMNKIRRRIEMLDLSDDWTISRKTMRFTFISLGITIIVSVVLIFLSQTLYFIMISVFTVYMLHKQIIKMLIDKFDNKLLRQFEAFLGNVRHHYHEHGMIDEAIYDSIEECDYEISLHANRMHEALTDSDVDDNIEKFNETAPNKYMKTFMAMSYLVQRFGDKPLEGKSIYLTNLNYLKQEINMELLRREKLGYLFQSLATISVIPIFTLMPLRNWALSNIPELHEYYNGTYGFVAVIILFALVVGAYQLIIRLQTSIQYAPLHNKLIAAILKIRTIRYLTDTIIEKKHLKVLKYERLLKKTSAQISINQFVLKQILYAVITLLLGIAIFTNIHLIARHNILHSSENLVISQYNNQIDMEAELKIIGSDRQYIKKYKGKKVTFQELDKTLMLDSQYSNPGQSGIAAKRILNKLEMYNMHTFKWWELIISLIISAISYNIPYWMLIFRERVLKMSMEDEVKQFHTIILMLMHIERVHVEDILNWMELFSDIFKSSIQKCINNYEYGDRQAMEQLIIDEPSPPFVRIIENLMSAADKITIEQAFDELKIEREYYQEKRKQDNEIMVNKKGMWGKIIAFIPLGATIFIYLLVPFLLVSAKQLMNFSEEISKTF